jgi:hypothetical protein
MRSLDDFKQVASAVCIVRQLLTDLPVGPHGDRSLSQWEYNGISGICSLISGELEAAHEMDRDDILRNINIEAWQRIESLRRAYFIKRDSELNAAGIR